MEPLGNGPGADAEGELAGLPSRAMLLLAFFGVVAAGILGALAGWGIVDTDTRGNGGSAALLAALAGGLVGAIGGGVIAVLILRARSHWRIPSDDVARPDPPDPAPRT